VTEDSYQADFHFNRRKARVRIVLRGAYSDYRIEEPVIILEIHPTRRRGRDSNSLIAASLEV
jgi:hypothetical protein